MLVSWRRLRLPAIREFVFILVMDSTSDEQV